MKFPHRHLGLAVLALSGAATLAHAAQPTSPIAQNPPDNGSCTDEQKAVHISAPHTIMRDGKPLTYTASVGFLDVTVDPTRFAGLNLTSGGNPADIASSPFTGCFFYTAYRVAPARNAPARPVTFAFNGGPGSASLWLHMGFMGPRRVHTGPTGLDVPNPPVIEDNPNSPIDFTDIVMIDPVGTGYSHAKKAPKAEKDAPTDPSAAAQGKNQTFFGAVDDAESVSMFIETFLRTKNYNLSPVYILGESYGGVRGSLISQILPSALSTYPKGMIFVSPCLTTTMTDFTSKDVPIAYLSFFPTMAEIARYHGKGIYANDKSLSNEQLFRKAYDFAMHSYVPAVMAGTYNAPYDPDYVAVAKQLADFTGMPMDHFAPVNSQGVGLDLRLTDEDFFSNLEPGLQMGRFDGRWTGPRTQDKGGYNFDPSDSNTTKAFVPAVNEYLTNELKMTTTHPYIDSANIGYWSMSSDSTEFVGSMNLGYALAQNPDLRIFIASGYYDLACPMGGVEYERGQIDRLANGLVNGRASNDPKTGGRVEIRHYAAGHMVYTNPEAAEKLHGDLYKFYARTYPQGFKAAPAPTPLLAPVKP